jgi:DNA/RNA-binding domain of Phe-tRNA-synthetase-like protein
MKFDITNVIEKYPDVHIGVLTAMGINNLATVDGLKALQQEVIKEAERQIGDEPPIKHPHIASWREMYRSFGTKPGDYRPSAEALIRRAIKTGELPTINTAVDIYNLVSVRHIIPMGGFDIDDVRGTIHLRFSEGGEGFIPLGAAKQEETYSGEVVYSDDSRILTRRWNFRDCDETKITGGTVNLVMFIDASSAIPVEKVQEALDGLHLLLERYCGGSYSTGIASKENPFIDHT